MTMVQVAWATLGLLAVVVFGMFGMFFHLAAKIDGMEQRLGGLIDAIAARLDAHVERHAG
jgi:hypothetical protein